MSDRGDTIVEVLICILIISSVLAGAFATTNQSLRSVRSAQERSQAIRIAETQLERLRNLTLADVPATSFCMDVGGVVTNDSTNKCYFDSSNALLTTTAVGTLSTSGPTNGYYSHTDGVRYKVVIEKNGNLYTANIRWITLNSELGRTTMYYKVYAS